MKRCPTCGDLTIVDTWNFCRRDGAKLVPAATCPNCGTEGLDSDKFCVKCGERLVKEVGAP
jgi:predicted RNA-binding Zn-ribbon protein involved in translation (DUF1610 family)